MHSASAANAPWLEVAAGTFSGYCIAQAATFDTDAEARKVNKVNVRIFFRTTANILTPENTANARHLVF